MKKYSLTLILVLCLFVITGGVYATWLYSDGAVATISPKADVSITTPDEAAAKGSLEATSNTLELAIDETSPNSLTPELAVNGQLVITYTSVESLNSAPDFNFTITQTGSVFTISSKAKDMVFTGSGKTWSCTLTNSELGITLAKTAKLPTRTDYDNFKKDLNAANVTITINEGKAA